MLDGRVRGELADGVGRLFIHEGVVRVFEAVEQVRLALAPMNAPIWWGYAATAGVDAYQSLVSHVCDDVRFRAGFLEMAGVEGYFRDGGLFIEDVEADVFIPRPFRGVDSVFFIDVGGDTVDAVFSGQGEFMPAGEDMKILRCCEGGGRRGRISLLNFPVKGLVRPLASALRLV